VPDDRYICWGEDKEDLTAAVIASLSSGSSAGATAFQDAVMETDAQSNAKTVIVTCSKGHQNVFDVKG
jgi:hypothetical protein